MSRDQHERHAQSWAAGNDAVKRMLALILTVALPLACSDTMGSAGPSLGDARVAVDNPTQEIPYWEWDVPTPPADASDITFAPDTRAEDAQNDNDVPGSATPDAELDVSLVDLGADERATSSDVNRPDTNTADAGSEATSDVVGTTDLGRSDSVINEAGSADVSSVGGDGGARDSSVLGDGPDVGPACTGSLVALCGGACRDLALDPSNCGSCGTTCASGQVCSNGACVVSCGGGLVRCSAVCRDTLADLTNCGRCGNTCASGQVCSNGSCAVSCAVGLTNCSGTCRDLTTDNNHCGGCGTTCASGQICSAGVCQFSCRQGTSNCNGFCRDLQSDVRNCGACGMACASGQVCSNGTCSVSCGIGLTNCGGVCRDLTTDNNHCRSCGNACSGGQVCSNGACQVSCGEGFNNCSGRCRDLANDRLHCGACGRACSAGQNCVAGACVTECPVGQNSCNGVCVDLQTSRTHCGICSQACGTGQYCEAGVCVVSCTAGTMNCSGICRDLASDTANCGGCGNSCRTTPNTISFCNMGRCLGTCSLGFADCDGASSNGCEAELRSSVAHCGGCGRSCGEGWTCTDGTCVSICTAGLTYCAGVCRDLQSDRLNCGSCGRSCGRGTCTSGVCEVLGTRCRMNVDCGPNQTCMTTTQGSLCTWDGSCTQGTPEGEAAQCGGVCMWVTNAPSPVGVNRCTRGCVPTATSERLGACSEGFVCTTNWIHQQPGTNETVPGCLPLCASDNHCAGVRVGGVDLPLCNTRTGQCVASRPPLQLRSDGDPCNPTDPTRQCRSLCFSTNSLVPTQGLCGSLINLRTTQECPDYPIESMLPRVARNDNMAACFIKECARNAECPRGLLCVYPEESTGAVRSDLSRWCNYATANQPSGTP